MRIWILVDLRIKEEISAPERPYFGSFQTKLTMQFSWQYQKPFAHFLWARFPQTDTIYLLNLPMGQGHNISIELKIYIAFTHESNVSGLKMDQAYFSMFHEIES